MGVGGRSAPGCEASRLDFTHQLGHRDHRRPHHGLQFLTFMWQSFKPFFEWSDKFWLGQAISGTVWAFPVIETIHILALTMMFGAIVIVDMRMLGLGLRKQSV